LFELGNSLREARTRRGIEFAQAEQATKIRGKYLRALEDERFDLLPSETYVRGFLRTYSDYLGLDGQIYVDEFNSRFVTGDEYDSPPRRSRSTVAPRERRLERRLVLVALAAIAVVTIVVISAWKSSGPEGASPAKPAPAASKPRSGAAAPYLTVAGVHGASYVAVRRDGPSGRVVFEGMVERGERLPLRGKRFWLNVSAPENLLIRVGGQRVTVGGFRPRVITVTPQGWQEG
jgi:cytoskeleton protein RodZ